MSGILYVIGINRDNLDDNAPSVISALKNSALIACESKADAEVFLKNAGIDYKGDLISMVNITPEAVLEYLDNKGNVSLLSDDGYAAICDPGFDILNKALEQSHNVRILPQVSAILSSWLLSGLISHRNQDFFFGGMINFHWDEQQIKIISDHAQDTCIFLSVHPDWNNSGDKLNELLFDVYGNDRKVTLLFDIGTNRQTIIKCHTGQLVETIRSIDHKYVSLVIHPTNA